MVAKVWAAVGDITEQDVDAVVNAANRWLASGGGVCGAIFAAAGYEEMEKHCSNLLRAEGIEAAPSIMAAPSTAAVAISALTDPAKLATLGGQTGNGVM